MPKYRIFAVEFDFPGDDIEDIAFESDQTLLDADIILFEPTLGNFDEERDYRGKPLLTPHSSFRILEKIKHWRSEIIQAVKAGKLVIFYLVKPDICYFYTGDQSYSGTGRNRVTTADVLELSSYAVVPQIKKVVPKSGSEITLGQGSSPICDYWREFAKMSSYEVVVEGDFSEILLKSKSGERIIGASFSSGGTLLFLPPLRYDYKHFVTYNKQKKERLWTNQAIQCGRRLIDSLVELADTIKKPRQITPAPSWTRTSEFHLSSEQILESSISTISSEIEERQSKRNELLSQLDEAGLLRNVLFEYGKLLENAVIEALGLLGFETSSYAEGDSEFDCIFTCSEGRCLGEIEGKDNKPINIDKMSQLERNIQEDYARPKITSYAKGVLFGNAFRLKPISERSEFFTEKCLSAAKRSRFALVRTPDLFAPAKYLKENNDPRYAKKCRTAILKCEGSIVVFPTCP